MAVFPPLGVKYRIAGNTIRVFMILIDGVKYSLWTPENEVKEFHPIIKANSKEIFGEDSVFFDVKQKLASSSSIAFQQRRDR